MDDIKQIKVLVVEDEIDAREIYIEVLKNDGFKVYSATNGQEALDVIIQTEISIVLLDIVMPVKDGVHMLSDLQKIQNLPSIPKVIAFSNIDGQKVTDRVKELGADAYMLKSDVDVNDLPKIILKILG